MPIIDLGIIGKDEWPALKSDICIVGSGPAGCTIARECSGLGLQVTMLESGGFERDREADALNEIDNIGRPRVLDQWAVRNRIVGGSSHTWGGRCAPFDSIDFEARTWVPDSGWPFGMEALDPYLDRTAPYLGLAVGRGFNDERFWAFAGRSPPPSGPDPEALLPFFWQFSRDDKESYPFEYMRFGRDIARRLGPNVTLITGATVLTINTVPSGRAVTSVEFAAPDGRRRSVASSTVILCAGGIENARLLLSSNDTMPNGLGNEHDVVGRYLMDHPRGAVGSFDVRASRALQKLLGRFNVGANLFRAGLRLSPEVQRAERLLNCAAWLGEVVAPDDPWEAMRRFALRKPRIKDAVAIATNVALLPLGAKDYFIDGNGVPRKYETLTLDSMCEQRPDRDSRITLSDRRDRYGTCLPRVDWRVHADELRTMKRMAELISEQFDRMGFPRLVLADWVRDGADLPSTFVDVAHPTGTTRMSDDPRRGVVDRDCRVHGVDGLYVSGSSVFPTSGHCNPTQMIVALALRLADHLKSRFATVEQVSIRTVAATKPRSQRILVTGATGRIGPVVVADLIERGYLVRATTSKEPPRPDHDVGAVEWRRFDFHHATDYDDLVAGCDAVLHIAAELGDKDRMWRTNVEATRRLAAASERAGLKAFCYISSVAVYGSGLQRIMTEDAPVLTADRDIRSEYWALDYVRAYGRTKLGGELALRQQAKDVRYTVLRPTVVVDVAGLVGIRDWPRVKRTLAAHRHAHHVYVRDVSAAVIWAMERAFAGSGAPGSIETFNVSEDEFSDSTHASFLRKAYAASRDPRFRVMVVQSAADWLHDFLRFRTLPLRNPLWRMRFPSDRIRAAGFRPRFGLAEAHRLALASILDERREVPRPSTPSARARNADHSPIPIGLSTLLRRWPLILRSARRGRVS